MKETDSKTNPPEAKGFKDNAIVFKNPPHSSKVYIIIQDRYLKLNKCITVGLTFEETLRRIRGLIER